MLLNFNMLINCRIIISMELNLNSILIFNELTKTNLIVMNTNTFNDDRLLILEKKCVINILIFWEMLLTIFILFYLYINRKSTLRDISHLTCKPHQLWLLCGEAEKISVWFYAVSDFLSHLCFKTCLTTKITEASLDLNLHRRKKNLFLFGVGA